MLKRLKKTIVSQRGVNAVFVLVCIAGAFGVPNAVVMLVSAALYAVLVWVT